VGADLTDVPLPEGVDMGYQTDWRKFSKLDCMDRPGLTEVQFFGLFAKCDACKLIITRQMFAYHYCSPHAVDDSDPTDE
jgi:hypothetical protein